MNTLQNSKPARIALREREFRSISIVYDFRQGGTPEQIVLSFPTLNLEQIYGAIAFYLQNREEIDEYLRQGEIEFEDLSQAWKLKNAHFHEKLEKARQEVKI